MFLAVLAIAKNEAHVVDEWLDHYRWQGVDHFFIIDNDSSDDTVAQFRKHADVTLEVYPDKFAQVALYNRMVDAHAVRQRATWLLVVDLDEFAFATAPGDTLAKLAARVTDPAIGAVALPWVMFGSNGHVAQPPSVVSGFTRRKLYKPEGEEGELCKCLVRTSTLVAVGIHTSDMAPRALIANAHTLRPGPSNPALPRVKNCTLWLCEDLISNLQARVNHYRIQSLDYFKRVKMTRGSVRKRCHLGLRTLEYFKAFDTNDTEDTLLVSLRAHATAPAAASEAGAALRACPAPDSSPVVDDDCVAHTTHSPA